MRVTVDLDPKDVWVIEEQAEAAGITPGEALRRMLDERRAPSEPKRQASRTTRDYIGALVKAGIPDPVIAHRSGELLQQVRKLRKQIGYLPAPFDRAAWPELNQRRTT